MFSLFNIRTCVDTKTAVLIFKAHALSRIKYGGVLCIGANNSYLELLQKLINKCLRICLHNPIDANIYELHVEAKVLPLRVWRNTALMK